LYSYETLAKGKWGEVHIWERRRIPEKSKILKEREPCGRYKGKEEENV
jgi:hypothetical protein